MTRSRILVALVVSVLALACKQRGSHAQGSSSPAAKPAAPGEAHAAEKAPVHAAQKAPAPAAKSPHPGSEAAPAKPRHGGPWAVLETSMGEIEIRLFPKKAPKGVKNFLRYARSGAYDGTIFHRVKPDFVIQGGGFEPNMHKRRTRAPIPNEADNGLKNKRGTLCWARTPNPHSATNQFFINLKYNRALDHSAKTQEGWGYAVFAKVIRGMKVVDKISEVATTTKGYYADVPETPVVIKKVRIIPSP